MTKPTRWTAAEWEQANLTLWLRSGGKCWWCDMWLGEDAARHHRMRRREGGDSYSNVILLHSNCHNIAPNSVHQNPTLAIERGFIVPTWDDLRSTAVTMASGQRWFLDDLGATHRTDWQGQTGRL